MKLKAIFGTAAAGAMLATACAASADAWHHDRDHQGGPAHHVVVRRAYFPRERVFLIVRGHDDHYVNTAYISNGHYVIGAYDRQGGLRRRQPIPSGAHGLDLLRSDNRS